jgi:hypothetical protein
MIGTLLNGDYFHLNYLLKDLKFDNLPWIRLLGSTPSTWDNVFWNSVARSIPEILLTSTRLVISFSLCLEIYFIYLIDLSMPLKYMQVVEGERER